MKIRVDRWDSDTKIIGPCGQQYKSRFYRRIADFCIFLSALLLPIFSNMLKIPAWSHIVFQLISGNRRRLINEDNIPGSDGVE